MHKEVLNKNQVALFPVIKEFSTTFGLVGGTAVALYLGHRRSIDFDLFTNINFSNDKLRNTIRNQFEITQTLVDDPDELTVIANFVKLTFYKYPFKLDYAEDFEDIVKLPPLLTLAAMKAFALGRRAKWKDYVDLHFIFDLYGIHKVIKKAKEMFSSEFNERLFRTQLAYFDDIDYSEEIEYMPGFSVLNSVIKEKLKSFSLEE